MKYGLLFMLACVWVSCNSPKTKADTAEMETKAEQGDGLQIGDYVVETFQDSKVISGWAEMATGPANLMELLLLTSPSMRV